MKHVTQELNQIIDTCLMQFKNISDVQFAAKPNPVKWSKQEVLGHLIDSAHSNLRRFVCAQYESTPSKITYDQNFWVTANNYQQTSTDEIITLWKLMNKRIIAVLNSMPSANHIRESDTGKEEVRLHSLQWLAEDYIKHLKHHLNQIIPESFTITYP